MSDLPPGYLACSCGHGAARSGGACGACRTPVVPTKARSVAQEAAPVEPWSRTFTVEYRGALSKNRRTGFRDGTRFTPKETREARAELESDLAIHLRGAPIRQAKMHLELLATWRTRRRIDIINVVDEIADCVARATGVDDSLYSLCADYRYDPSAPSNRVRVTISQG